MNVALQMACMTCHKKNDRSKSGQLRCILFRTARNLPQREADPDARALESAILMEAKTRCPYGMPCPDLRSEEQEASRLARDAATAVASAVKDGTMPKKEAMEMFRGHFPRAYRVLGRTRTY